VKKVTGSKQKGPGWKGKLAQRKETYNWNGDKMRPRGGRSSNIHGTDSGGWMRKMGKKDLSSGGASTSRDAVFTKLYGWTLHLVDEQGRVQTKKTARVNLET